MKKRIINVLLILILFMFILFAGIKFLDLINFKCAFKKLFGIYCAGCGTTRMIKSILSFKFYQAFRYNPLMFILFILVFTYVVYNMILYIKKDRLVIPNFKFIIIIIIILFIYMFLRNIPGFEYLLPTKI